MGEKCNGEEDGEKVRQYWRKINSKMGYKGYTTNEEENSCGLKS